MLPLTIVDLKQCQKHINKCPAPRAYNALNSLAEDLLPGILPSNAPAVSKVLDITEAAVMNILMYAESVVRGSFAIVAESGPKKAGVRRLMR